MQIKVYESPLETAENFAEYLYLKSKIKTSKDEFFHLAISGGRTPELFFNVLADRDDLEWSKIKLFWVDERCVPPDHADSNYRVTKEILLDNIDLPSENIFRMKGEIEPDKAAEQYSEILRNNVPMKNDVPSFDTLFLGLGEDGHTASIFPGKLDILDSEKLCLHTVQPYTKQNRLTLTAKVINNAAEVSFLITGENKARIFNQIVNQSPEAINYPAYHISTMNKNLIYWLDKSVVV